MRRREFITLLSGAAAACAMAQHGERPRLVGVVAGFSEAEMQPRLTAFRDKLNRYTTGFTNFEFTVGGKWLELLKELSPGLVHVTLISNPANPTADQFSQFPVRPQPRQYFFCTPARRIWIDKVAIN